MLLIICLFQKDLYYKDICYMYVFFVFLRISARRPKGEWKRVNCKGVPKDFRVYMCIYIYIYIYMYIYIYIYTYLYKAIVC